MTSTGSDVGGLQATDTTEQQALELILLKQWASHMTMPIWITSAEGILLYFNEPAERILGVRYGEADKLPVDELTARFNIGDEYGNPIEPRDLPLAVALSQRKPTHRRLRIIGDHGEQFYIAVTSFPIEGQGGRFLGAVAIFWEDDKA